ncbi:MAG: diguanylate phosphodiesterase [Proteobacteria bacterium]|nr:diguanylate phosphodiesterase [Pseudomonadota bacterium]
MDINSNIIAYELLADFSISQFNDFENLPHQERCDLFINQILLVNKLKDLSKEKRMFSVNITMDVAEYVINRPELLDFIFSLREILRIEISERFDFKNKTRMKDILTVLANSCPLWLDDFSDQMCSVDVLYEYPFEYIKIDKDFYWCYGDNSVILSLINKVCAYHSISVIVEGINSNASFAFARSLNFKGYQGHLWHSLSQDSVLSEFVTI